jgi:hypothetical protein
MEGIMRGRAISFISLGISATLAGCAGSPQFPNNSRLPVEDITNEAMCQVRDAFLDLAPEGKDAHFLAPANEQVARQEKVVEFDAKNWAIGISLSPTTTTDFSISATGSGTNNPKGRDIQLPTLSWSTASTGVDLDRKAITSGSVAYTLPSSIFYKSQNVAASENTRREEALRSLCDGRAGLDAQSHLTNFIALSSDMGANPNNHDLVIRNDLGIENWMIRILVPAAPIKIVDKSESYPILTFANASAKDTPAFNYQTHITITATAQGGITWAPPGLTSHLTSLGLGGEASRIEDVVLNVTFLYDPKKPTTKTGDSGHVSPDAAKALHNNANMLFQLNNLKNLLQQ